MAGARLLALTLVSLLSLPACSDRPPSKATGPVDGGAPTDAAASASASPLPAPRAWIDAAGDLCANGLELYPSVRLGHRADVDTVSYGLTEYARSLAEVDLPSDEPVRTRALALVERAAVVASRWQGLAVAQDTTVAERRAAAQEAATVLSALAQAGAQECSALAPEVT